MTKRILFLITIILVSSFMLGACTTEQADVEEQEQEVEEPEESEQEEPAEEANEPAGEKKVIGLASFQQGNDWNLQVAQGAKEKIEELGWEVIHTDANADSSAHIASLEGFLTQEVDGVIVPGGMGGALEPVIAQLIEAGIPTVTVDLTIPDAVTNIYPDSYMATELLCVFSLNKLNGQTGTYVHLGIPGSGWKAVDIRTEMADFIFEFEGWKMTNMVDTGITDAVSLSITGVRSALLANPDIDLVYSSWGFPAIGAARAIREAGKTDEVFVVNTDADRVVLAEMAEDDSPIAAVIGQQPLLMGRMAVETLQKAFAGDEDIPKISYAPFVVVTKEPHLLPPGVTYYDPVEAWEVLYPDIPFGETE